MTAYQLAERYIGIAERLEGDHPLIRWWHSLTTLGEAADEVSWCSSFVNGIAWELRLPRSKSAAARSWLQVGAPVPLGAARIGYDVVVLWRDSRESWKGHVGWYGGQDLDHVYLLGGNQGNAVSVRAYPVDQILGIRRLRTEVTDEGR